MKILNYLKSKFINPSGTLVKYTIPIPTREIYKDNQDKLNNIEEYKNKYLKILTIKKLVSFKELELDNLQSNLDMITHLLIHNLIDNDNFLYFIKSELMVKSAKLEMYLWELSKYETETILRIIALNELKENKKLPKHNKKHLILELDNLMTNLTIYMVQKEAIIKEKDNYLNRVIINKEEDNGYIEERYKYLYELANETINLTKLNELTTKESKLAYLERELEIYTYKNKSNLKELLNELKKLEIQKKTPENREELLKIIKGIENKLLLFYEFEYINEEEFKKILKYLYHIKFDILVSIFDSLIFLEFSEVYKNSGTIYFCNKNTKETIKRMNFNNLGIPNKAYKFNILEEETYRDILTKKLKSILKDDNNFLQNTFKNNKNNVIDLINKWFNDIDDFKSIIKLKLLLSLEKENGFENFINNVYRNVEMPPNQDVTVYTYLTLKTLYDLKLGKSVEDDITTNILVLYDYISEKDNDRYYIPERLTEYTYKAEYENKFKKFILNILRLESNGKKVIFPSTMKRIEGPLFKNNNVSEIILNDGLEYIGHDALIFDGKSITIPTSVKKIYEAFGKNQKLYSIIFEDYENSELLKNGYLRTLFFISLINQTAVENQETIDFKVNKIILKNKYGMEYIINLEDFRFRKHFENDQLGRDQLATDFAKFFHESFKVMRENYLKYLNEQQFSLEKALIRNK